MQRQMHRPRASAKRKTLHEAESLANGTASEWQAAARKKRRLEESRSSPLRSLNQSEINRKAVPGTRIPVKVDQELSLQHERIPSTSHHNKSFSSSPATPATRQDARQECHCGNPANDAQGLVTCVNPSCKVRFYHKKCVGLVGRDAKPNWPCVACRPPRSSSQDESQAQSWPLSQQDGTSQPPPGSQSELLPLSNSGPPDPPLHPEQERVVRCIEEGHNVFYTGSAGTGKSTVLKAFVQRLKRSKKHVDIVAPSGIAALNVHGTTIFSYAYWHPDSFKNSLEALLKNSHSKSARKRLCTTDVLVIDEISMVERDLFYRLDVIMREIRERWKPEGGSRQKPQSRHSRKLPFGGVQLVVTGDFCQLPPVKPFRFCVHCGGDELPGWSLQDGRVLKCKKCPLEYADADKWAFRSQAWENCAFRYFELRHVHRQNDERFINILQKCRLGKHLLSQDEELLTAPKPDPAGAVRLLPRRREVDDENFKNFGRLQGLQRSYGCLDVFDFRNKNEPELKKKGAPRYPDKPDGALLALKDHRFEQNVQLKPGMLVILLINLDFPAGLVNGSQGKIIRFEKYDPKTDLVPRPRESSPDRSGRHGRKSRATNEHTDFKEAQIREFINRAEMKEWPVVQFYNGETRSMYASCQLSELGSEKPYSLIGRTQIPLLAAWAITVHKSQGMTLNRVIIDLHNSFESEMVYVALSRARNLQGLKVIRLAQIKAQGSNREVRQFLEAHFGTTAGYPCPSNADIALIEHRDPWQQWRSSVEEAFADYAAMQAFPCPPLGPCSKISCSADKSRMLLACQCNIQAAFTRIDDLRKERSRWHPDRFSKLPHERRELFQKMAMEVFVVVDSMWQRSETDARE